jgi:hypothetical protein
MELPSFCNLKGLKKLIKILQPQSPKQFSSNNPELRGFDETLMPTLLIEKILLLLRILSSPNSETIWESMDF